MKFKIPFSGRQHKYSDNEVNAVVHAMRNADPLTQGDFLHEFEKKICHYLGVENAFAVCNATAALEMAAQFCGFQEGDEVVIPSHTYTSSAYPFLKKGATVVWADIDPQSRVATARTISDCITPRTKVIVVPHLYGYGAYMPKIMDVAKSYKLLVIEDAAQALGVEIDGKKAGTFGDFGVISFHSHKNISTLGEGGVLVVQNNTIADRVPMLRHNGHCAFPFERKDYWIPAMGNVDFPELEGKILWPNNYCLGEVECALGLKLLERIDEMNGQKRKRALDFITALSEFPNIEFHLVKSVRHNYHLLAAKINNNQRDNFIRKMATEKGIQCVVQYYPLNRYALYQKAGFGSANCPNADHFFDNMVSFPFHHSLTEEDLDYMVQSTKEVLGGLSN